VSLCGRRDLYNSSARRPEREARLSLLPSDQAVNSSAIRANGKPPNAQKRKCGRPRSAQSILHFMKGNHHNCRSLDRDLNPVPPRSKPTDRGCVLVTNQRPGNGKGPMDCCEIRQRTLDAHQEGSQDSRDSTRVFVNERCQKAHHCI
jgi:hypothetical protein